MTDIREIVERVRNRARDDFLFPDDPDVIALLDAAEAGERARGVALEECEQKLRGAIINATVVGRIGLRTAYEIIRSLRRPA